jgi:sensor c-di-GMP phosphodiesterase-like protein
MRDSKGRGKGIRQSSPTVRRPTSSMAYLKHLAVDALKLDRSFVHDMAESHEDAAIVRSIVALAHALELTVVAQGFELGRPMAAEGFAEWLTARGAASAGV